jgi:hypothetical protein
MISIPCFFCGDIINVGTENRSCTCGISMFEVDRRNQVALVYSIINERMIVFEFNIDFKAKDKNDKGYLYSIYSVENILESIVNKNENGGKFKRCNLGYLLCLVKNSANPFSIVNDAVNSLAFR